MPDFKFPQELMLPEERDTLAQLITDYDVQSYLEIGSAFGGSAVIVFQAMKRKGTGKIVCVDNRPEQIDPATRNFIKSRAVIFKGTSPDILAPIAAGSYAFDFVLIDADHRKEHVIADVMGLLDWQLLLPGARLLFHDAHYHGVAEALTELLAARPELIDEGWETTGYTWDDNGVDRWGGLRLLQYSPGLKEK